MADTGTGYDPATEAAVRHALAAAGVNTLGTSNTATLNGVLKNTTTHQAANASTDGSGAYNKVAQNLSKQAQKNIESQLKINRSEISARVKIAQMQIGQASENTAAQVAVEREKIQQAYAQMQQIGIPQLELDRWKAQKETELQTDALQLQKDQFAWEKDKDQQTIEFEKAKWRDQNTLAIRAQDFSESSFAQNLQYERERDAATLGLDRDKYLQQKTEQDRQYDLSVQQFGFQSSMAVRDAALRERAQAASEQQFGQTLAEQQRQFNTNTALDVVKTGATMGGPGDWANFLDYSEGVQNTGDVPVFVNRLLGQSGAGGGAATGAAPPARSLVGVAQRLSGGATGMVSAGQPNGAPAGVGQPGVSDDVARTPTDSANQAAGLIATNPPSPQSGWSDRDLAILGKISDIYRAPQKVQGYEQTNPDEKAFLAGGAAKAGYSQPTFDYLYKTSRIGQTAA